MCRSVTLTVSLRHSLVAANTLWRWVPGLVEKQLIIILISNLYMERTVHAINQPTTLVGSYRCSAGCDLWLMLIWCEKKLLLAGY